MSPAPPSSSSSSSSLAPLRPPLARSPRVQSWASYDQTETPYTAGAGSRLTSISDEFALSPDIREWGAPLTSAFVEPDDAFHDPNTPPPGRDRSFFARCVPTLSERGFLNGGFLLVLCLGCLALFAGYPIITYFTKSQMSTLGAFNLGGTNASGQVPTMPGNFALIDADTPHDVYTKASWNSGEDMQLVFSDEFNTDGRTFWPGDDPYWEAADLHYWETNNLEWYSPLAITTQGGSLVITLSEKESHNLSYQGGMMSSWNKFCFTGGYIETNVSLPGVNNVQGLWPAVWTMGNLGRAGYGASLDGLWPYTYDSCDIGTVPNQTINGQPAAATVNGDTGHDGILSFLDGQRLSRCTCAGENHPGPKHSDGTFVGRSAPEIDVFEAQVTAGVGQVSQSAQWAPFNEGYWWYNTSQNMILENPSISAQNPFIGSVTQEATSIVTSTNQVCYEGVDGCYTIYGFEYVPGFDNAYITWVATNTVSWTLNVAGLGADPRVNISARPVPQEPMYIIMNLGMSYNFGPIDLTEIDFPVHLSIDYVRVYQPKSAINVGCNPKDFPTEEYINKYIDAYTNPNLTSWTGDYGQEWPKNSYLGQC